MVATRTQAAKVLAVSDTQPQGAATMTDSREARIEAMRARRSTPEFAAAGAALLEQKRQAREAKRAAEDSRFDDYWRAQADALPLGTLAGHQEAFEDLLGIVAADQGCTILDLDDGRAIEALDAYVAQLPVNRRSAAIAVDLYRRFGLSANETLSRLARS